MKKHILLICISISLIVFASNPQIQAESGHLTIGLYGSMLQTTGDIKDWYSTSPGFSGVLGYEFSGRRFQIEAEVYHTSFRDAGLENREFRWLISGGGYVKSPDAKASMDITGVSVNGVFHLIKGTSSKFVPYLIAGIGFYHYNHRVSGLIWPGQLEQPLDPTLLLPSYKDSGSSQLLSAGGGITRHFPRKFVVDMRVQWLNFSEIALRPLDAWNLELVRSASGIQAFLGVRYTVL